MTCGICSNKQELKEIVAEKWTSRKYKTAWYITWLLTALFLLPPLASFILSVLVKSVEFILVPVEYYIPSILILWGLYYGVNLVGKMPAFGGVVGSIVSSFKKKTEDTNQDSGGQPEGSDNP